MKSQSIDISVIVPTFKPGGYFEECLASIGAQSFDSNRFEIIIVLNGCSDPWLTNVKKLIEKYLSANIVIFIHTLESGVSNARNIGIDIAKGRYITFIDDDDYISQNYLVALYDAVDSETVSVCDSFPFDDITKEEKHPYRPHDTYTKLIGCHEITLSNARALFNGPWMKLINREFINDFRFDTKLEVGEDSLFMFAISKNIKGVQLADRRATYYRRCRSGSSYSKIRPTSYWIKNCLNLTFKYSALYFRSPFSYDLKFYLSRIMGTLLVTFEQITNRFKTK